MADDARAALAAYVPGTRAWFQDKELGWVSATLNVKPDISANGEVSMVFDLDDGSEGTKQVKTSIDKLTGKGADSQLPPLRNPPLLEATDDLTNLSYLNEPSGEQRSPGCGYTAQDARH